MKNYDLNDTIAAIATSFGEAGIGIVRLSGPAALKIADVIFKAKNGKRPSEFQSYTLRYGWVEDKGEVIDEALLTVMRAPASFTRQDMAEINCHGGIVALRRVLDLVLEKGARLAQPGEFTKRAFLNGRIDLAQAEAVLDIIQAKTDAALAIGAQQLKGGLSKTIQEHRKGLLDILAGLEASIDFPEEEIQLADFSRRLQEIDSRLQKLLSDAASARILREGIHTVICGKANTGKSSLLNALLKRERSIVTPIAGTTRDAIEEIIDIKGIPVRIVDTAGIIQPRDLAEKKAIQRSRQHIRLADLIILLLDGSRKLDKEDKYLINKLAAEKTIAVINKIDLPPKINKAEIKKKFPYLVEISAKKMRQIDLLEEAITGLVYRGSVRPQESLLVANTRHIELLRQAEKLIAQSLKSMDNKLPLEFIVQGIKDALGLLDDILGKRFSEDLLDKIFSEFCIGK